MAGTDVIEHLKDKNKNLALYPAFLIIVLTKNLKLLYLNIDSLLVVPDAKTTPGLNSQVGKKMTVFDKIYGQQSFIICSKLIPTTSKQNNFLLCLSEFRLTYV